MTLWRSIYFISGLILILCPVLWPVFVLSSVNLAYQKDAYQSSEFGGWGPSMAVDGVFANDVGPGQGKGSCSHTLPEGYSTAWWMVDLGQISRIQTINITYRMLYTFRMSGYYLYVSNDSFSGATESSQIPQNFHLCYHDSTQGNNSYPSYNQSRSCPINGRYVIFYNKRPADNGPKNNKGYSTRNAVVELCEVQVFGCNVSKFGETCSETCHCDIEGCNPDTGICDVTGCQSGWKGLTCSTACNGTTFGKDCDQICHCKQPRCQQTTGCCHIQGCELGWKGSACDIACTNRSYGYDCNQTCHCATSGCNYYNGKCNVTGCAAGWKGEACNIKCNSTTYGENCAKTCHCKQPGCNSVNGICNTQGCSKGWRGQSCEIACTDNSFGYDCNQTCHCAVSGCNRYNGKCNVSGCEAGWKGEACDTPCTNRSFGYDCIQTCHCAVSGCNRYDGKCNVSGCVAGWRGEACDTLCSNRSFGHDCNQTCHCAVSGCNRYTGKCNASGCGAGWRGEACDLFCNSTEFGVNCANTCHCQEPGCNRINGICNTSGCERGWQGLSCNTSSKSVKSEEENGGNYTGIGIGCGVAILTILGLIIAVVFWKKRRMVKDPGKDVLNKRRTSLISRRKADEKIYVNVSNAQQDAVQKEQEEDTKIEEEEVVYVNDPGDRPIAACALIKVADLKNIVRRKHMHKVFDKEYASLDSGLRYPHEVSKLPENLQRNRFKATFAYDHTRVILKKEKNTFTDYINANYINGIHVDKEYIATQGPKVSTREDFWRMIWQNYTGKIVMLANLIELGKHKCCNYWASEEGGQLELTLFKVTLLKEKVYAFYSVRTISLKNKQTNAVRTVSQFHFTHWPDHGVPDPFELIQFHKRVQAERTDLNGPLVVHCSAGIGRTGTYIGLDALLKEGQIREEVDILAYTAKMRRDRMNMIQTLDQYKVLHDALVEGLGLRTLSMPRSDCSMNISDLLEDDVLKHHFELIENVKPAYDEGNFVSALSSENKQKNKDITILPVEKYRPYLTSRASNYINAINMPSHRHHNGYILTQHPMNNTVIDFWCLLSQSLVETVISIGVPFENWKWPTQEGDEKEFGDFTIQHIENSEHKVRDINVTERKLSLHSKGSDDETTVVIFEAPSWKENLPEPKLILELVKIILSQDGNPHSPVFITCEDGATESGLLCLMCNVIERLETDGDVDIMATARQIQIRRPQCIPSVAHYKQCYLILMEYLESSVYANV